jgi:hypothetical protein
MVYKIKEFPNKKIERYYNRSMEELADFYGFKMNRNRPRIIIVDDRKTINSLKGSNTEDWNVGWQEARSVFVLNQNKTGIESRERYNDERYKALIKHELSHAFLRSITRWGYVPVWLNEGIAIYVSGQNKFKKPINNFVKFLESYDKADRDAYKESGFAIEILINEFGKKKLLTLVKKLKGVENKSGFIKTFKDIYGFSPLYAKFNRLK